MSFTLARHLNVPEHQAEEFQRRYFEAFPGIREWHLEVQRRLQSARSLTTALGRERLFLGRVDSRETLKEALAWYPQSLISDILKIGMLRIWRKYEKRPDPLIRLHADMHDGLFFSIKESYLDEIVPDIINLMTVPIQYPCGVLTIPVDFTVGYRWQKKEMLDWEPGVLGKLTRPEPTSLLDLEASLIEKT
jgi:DNA polymerase I-like protein with 3'-5' exonuclease and polymerase domains